MQEYSSADLTRLFHLSPSLVRSLARAGFVARPAEEGKTRYSFQDLLVLRAAAALKAAKIPSSKITAALGKIRAALPPGSLLTTMALAASGKQILVQEGSQTWEASSGQYALPLDSEPRESSLAILPASAKPSDSMLQAQHHYERGHELEETDLAAARMAYIKTLEFHRDHLEARINLGRLLHLAGELKEAEKVYRQAKQSSALLSFNLAILLEDLNREDEAVEAYREALALDPFMHDAHFNLARLHEHARRPREALRHLLAYRRHLTRHGN